MKSSFRVFTGVLLIASGCTRGTHTAAAGPEPSARSILYYVDPMHPAYRSDWPGKAPDCGMDLEPVYAGTKRTATTPGGVHLTSDQEQAIQLRTEVVESRQHTSRIETAGQVVPLESLTYRITAGVDGWVTRVFHDETGSYVTIGQALAAFYSKDVRSPQQAFLYALESREKLRQTGPAPREQVALAEEQFRTARENLLFIGMDSVQIDALARNRTESSELRLTAPHDGRILDRNMAVGQRFSKGDTLYRIADLSRVWLVADVYAGDIEAVRAAVSAQVQVPGMPSKPAVPDASGLQFNPDTRTGKLRLKVDNLNRAFVPGMVANISLEIPIRSAMTLSSDAVIDSGLKKFVFVANGEGTYQLREVTTGFQDADRIEIVGGLRAGERVVTSGAFLLDSETRMKASAADL